MRRYQRIIFACRKQNREIKKKTKQFSRERERSKEGEKEWEEEERRERARMTGAKGVQHAHAHAHGSVNMGGKEGEKGGSKNGGGGEQRTASTERLEDMRVDIADANTGTASSRARRHDTPRAGEGGVGPARV